MDEYAKLQRARNYQPMTSRDPVPSRKTSDLVRANSAKPITFRQDSHVRIVAVDIE